MTTTNDGDEIKKTIPTNSGTVYALNFKVKVNDIAGVEVGIKSGAKVYYSTILTWMKPRIFSYWGSNI